LTPDDRQFGRLEGKVDELSLRVGNVERAIAEQSATSSAEHAEVARKLDALNISMAASLKEQGERIDSLESTRDQQRGAMKMGDWLKAGLIALASLTVAVAGLFLGIR